MDNAQPDLSALRQLMSSRGMNSGILDQNNPQAQAAPRVQPQGAPSFAIASPEAMSQMTTQPAQQPAPQGTGLPSGSPEAMTIIKALSSRLSTLGKLGQ